jgi:pseudouridine synthase
VLTASTDPIGRVTVSELVDHPLVREGKARIYPVGRLEWEATGLVLLTNDGQLAHRLTHPSFGVPRVYEVLAKGIFDTQSIQELEDELNRRAQQLARRAGKRPKDRITVQRITIKDPEEHRAAMDPGANVKTILHITVPPGGASSSSYNDEAESGGGPGGFGSQGSFGRDVPRGRPGLRGTDDIRRQVGLRVAPHRGASSYNAPSRGSPPPRGPHDFDDQGPTERDIHRSARLGDMLNSIGVRHTRVTQIGLGPLRLTDVRVGMWRPLERHEVTMLKKFASAGDKRAASKSSKK